MPRMQVYLSDELYRYVKDNDLPASQLLQSAVEAEMERQLACAEADRLVADLKEEFGPADPADEAWAEALADRITAAAHRETA